MRSIIGAALAGLGLILVIVGRILSYDLTEGQAFVEYWPLWASAAACMLIGYLLIAAEERGS